MTIEKAQEIVANTKSPYLKRDMIRFIKRQRRKNNAKTIKGD